MLPADEAEAPVAPSLVGLGTMATESGKRHACSVCGAEVIVIKAGKSDLRCCQRPMPPKG